VAALPDRVKRKVQGRTVFLKRIVLGFFFKELESCAEIESTLLLALVMNLENVSFT